MTVTELNQNIVHTASEQMTESFELHSRFYELVKRTSIERDAHILANGAYLDVKHEGDQETGSFKERGAVNALLHLDQSDKVVTSSAGSFALAMARASQLLNRDVHIVAPESIAPSKQARLDAYKASYEIYGNTYDDARLRALSMDDRINVSPFDNLDVIIGHATPAIELLESYDKDTSLTIFVPVGGGGLLAGTLLATKDREDIKVVGIQLEGNDSLERSLNQKTGVCDASRVDTICEGSAVTSIGELPLEIIRSQAHRYELVTVKRAHVGAMVADELTKREQLIPVYGETVAMEGFPETTGLLAEAGAHVYARSRTHDNASQYIAIRTGSNVDYHRAYQALECHNRVSQALARRSTGLVIAKGWHKQK